RSGQGRVSRGREKASRKLRAVGWIAFARSSGTVMAVQTFNRNNDKNGDARVNIRAIVAPTPTLSRIAGEGVIALAVLLGACASAQAQAVQDEEPSVVPYRPSVSTPAALSAPGYLEIEAGGLQERGSGAARTDSVPYSLKLAFTPDWGVRVTGDA